MTPALDEIAAASTATSSGPTTKITSWIVASSANAVVRSSGRGSIAGHIIRIVGPIGGARRPAAIAAPTRAASGTPAWASASRPASATA